MKKPEYKIFSKEIPCHTARMLVIKAKIEKIILTPPVSTWKLL